MRRNRIALLLISASIASAQQSEGPSFSCAHLTSTVNKLICSTPELAKLDRQLALIFGNMRGQSIDQTKLRASEDAWLSALHLECSDATCIQLRYRARIKELTDQSQRAASPAAYDETLPFPAPDALLSEAQALVGTSCSLNPQAVGQDITGFSAPAHFLPVVTENGTVVVREKAGVRFAFLLTLSPGRCQIQDVVTLPAPTTGDTFLQCSVNDPAMAGFGVRNAKTHALYGFWSIEENQRIYRVPMGVLAIEDSVKCQQPETGE